MTHFTLNSFGGSIPRMEPHLLPRGAARRALDCKLTSGALASWREAEHIRDVPEGTTTSTLFDCCWLDFESCVDTALGPVLCKQLFVTGSHDYPVMMEFDEECEATVERLGVPCANAAPSVLVGALDPDRSSPKDVEGRSYAYQYVNARGLRGALSKASPPELVHDGQSVVVSGWEVPDASWGVTHVRIYRAVSSVGASMPTIENTMQNSLDTAWMLVEQVPIDAVSYTDTSYNEVLAIALEEDVVLPPPAELRGITHIASMNALAGYVGNRIYFSENNHYHDWPHYHDLDDNICGIVESNGTIYVATDGSPYAIPAVANCEDAACRQPVRLPVPYPMIGCGNRRMAALPQGAVYPSHNGLVALAGTNSPTLLTHGLYAPDDWQRLLPDTVTPVRHGGKLFVFARGGAFVLTLANGAEAGWALDNHSELSDTDVLDAFESRNGDLYLVKDSGIWRWDRGTTLRTHRWESPEFVTPTEVNFAAGHIRMKGGPERMVLSVDEEVYEDRPVYSSRQFRLPNWATGTRWSIVLEGTAQVTLFSQATSMAQLSA